MDHKQNLFTSQAALYAQYRPDYPKDMLMWIAKRCAQHQRLWDCGTGTGQVAIALAEVFDEVIATDVNISQLAHATKHPKIKYLQVSAEQSGIANQSVDLITVAQALHWFDHRLFNQEVRRVLKPDGTLAVWCYGLIQTNDAALNQIILKFYTEITAPYWAPERAHIDNQYKDIPLPFKKMNTPSFQIRKTMNIETLVAYFKTWSPVNTLLKKTGESFAAGHGRSKTEACSPR